MRVRSLLLVLAAIPVAACIPKGQPADIQAETIPHNASRAAATLAATEGLEDAGLDVQMRGPSLSTTWRFVRIQPSAW